MASDVIFDNAYVFEDFDSNRGDIFMSEGVMDPKELYMTDLVCSKDASSSDSGISTVDDLPDIANDTDLQSLIDADFKDLDFTFERALSKDGEGFDSDLLASLEGVVKTEPLSPTNPMLSDDICFSNTLSPDFYTLCDDISQSPDAVSVILPPHVKSESSGQQQLIYFQDTLDPQLHLQQSPVYSPQYSPHSSTDLSHVLSEPSSPLSSTGSPSVLTTYSPAPTHVTTTAHLPHSQQNGTAGHQVRLQSSSSPPLLNFTVLPSTPQSSIVVLPHMKREILTVSPSPPPAALSSIAKPTAAINLNTILSGNVKIQPKPGRDKKIMSIATASQWLPNAANQVSLPSQAGSCSILSPNSIAPFTDQSKTMKRAQRIIKNRESASLSRKRKKEYMSSLEERLQVCFDENNRLIRENEALKIKVNSLSEENRQLKVPSGFSPSKKICLMCLGLFLMVNLSTFSFLSVPTSGSFNSGAINPSPHHTGRQLLSVQPSNDSSDGSSGSRQWRLGRELMSKLDEELSLVVSKLNISANLADMCPMYFNSTESLRLAEQLTGWMVRQEEEKKKKDEKKRKQKRKKIYPTLRRFAAPVHMNAGGAGQSNPGQQFHGLVGNNYPVQLFSGPDPRQQMLDAIHRRNDTFYILSFSTDYFLVPATAHNKTMRPRMSLLMPVFTPTLNESTGQSQDSVTMMQIDCEIHNTNLIHLQRSDLPKDATLNSTTAQGGQHFHSHGDAGGRKNGSRRSDSGKDGNSTSQGDGQMNEGRGKYWENLGLRKAFT